MVDEPRVSVVAPFYNTAKYLAESIESVLAQTHSNFEYLLVNNQSTDGSREIALSYAAQDRRIKVFDNEQFVGQSENYNGALQRVAPDAKYVKIVQADDTIFPECLRSMVSLAEREPNVGLVSSYYMNGNDPQGSGVPLGTTVMAGKEALQRMLTTECFLLGTPTVVLYRADIVRGRRPFFSTLAYHDDTEAGYEILLEHEFGFVHQILSFARAQADSITSKRASFNPNLLDYLICLERYGRDVLSESEFLRISDAKWESYWRFLGVSLLRGQRQEFWEYHRGGLARIGKHLRWRDVLLKGGKHIASNPLSTAERLVANLNKRRPSAPTPRHQGRSVDDAMPRLA